MTPRRVHFWIYQYLCIQLTLAYSLKSEGESHSQGSKYKSLTLKNVHHPGLQNITQAPHLNSTELLPNPDSEPIFLPLSEQNIHQDEVLERLTDDQSSTPLGLSYDHLLLDFSAYLSKPFQFDYAKALSKAVDDAKTEVIATNYNLDASKFDGVNLNEKLSTDSQRTSDQFAETISESSGGPRAEKLVRHNPNEASSAYQQVGDSSLPIGFAFFDALREQNNRPYSQAFAQFAPKYTTFELTTRSPPLETTTSGETYQTTTRQTTGPVDNKRLVQTTTEAPEVEHPVTVDPSHYYQRQNMDSSEEYKSKTSSKQPYFRGFVADNAKSSGEASAEEKDHSLSDSYNDDVQDTIKLLEHKDESLESYEEPKYEYKVTDSNSYGTKPGMKFNKYSRIKVVQQAKPTKKSKKTDKKKRTVKKKQRKTHAALPSSYTPVTQTVPMKFTRKNDDRGSARFLYDDEVQHSSASNEFLIVVTPSPDMAGSASAQHVSWLPFSPPQYQRNSHPVSLTAQERNLSPQYDIRSQKYFQYPRKAEVSQSIRAQPPTYDLFTPATDERKANPEDERQPQKYLQHSPASDEKKPEQTTTAAPSKSKQKRPFEMRYFQDIFSAQMSPTNFEFGHVMESPDQWEERYESKDLATNRHQGKVNECSQMLDSGLGSELYVNVLGKDIYNAGVGKGHEDHYIESHELANGQLGKFQRRVRWGDKNGGFGEHYYDLNHHKPTKGVSES